MSSGPVKGNWRVELVNSACSVVTSYWTRTFVFGYWKSTIIPVLGKCSLVPELLRCVILRCRWGNSRLNTTTKPLFEETLNIVFECLDKYTSGHPLLPIECLKNYQLIYNEDDDMSTLLRDDNQMLTDRLAIRYSFREASSRTPVQRLLPRVSTARTVAYTPIHSNTDILLPLVNIPSDALPVPPSSSSLALPRSVSPPSEPSADEPVEPLKHCDDLELERLIQPKLVKCSTAFSSSTHSSRPVVKTRKSNIKRGQSTTSSLMVQRKRRIDLTPMIFDNRRYVNRQTIIPKCTETSPKLEMKPLNRVILDENIKTESSHCPTTAKLDDQSLILSSVNLNLSEVSSVVWVFLSFDLSFYWMIDDAKNKSVWWRSFWKNWKSSSLNNRYGSDFEAGPTRRMTVGNCFSPSV